MSSQNIPLKARTDSPIQPNSGHRDNSRLSCGGGDTQLGPRAKISAGILAPALEVALDRAAGGVEGNNGAGIEIVAWTLIAEPGATVAGTPEGRLVSGSLVPVIQIEASPRL